MKASVTQEFVFFSVNMYGTKGFSQNLKQIPTTVVECLKEDLGTRNLDPDYNITNSKLHNQLIDNTKTSEYSKSVIEMLLCMRNVCVHTCIQVHTHISAYVYCKNYVCACSCMYVFLHFALKEPRIICDPAVGKSLTVSAQI